jgi:hypothetical protein
MKFPEWWDNTELYHYFEDDDDLTDNIYAIKALCEAAYTAGMKQKELDNNEIDNIVSALRCTALLDKNLVKEERKFRMELADKVAKFSLL